MRVHETNDTPTGTQGDSRSFQCSPADPPGSDRCPCSGTRSCSHRRTSAYRMSGPCRPRSGLVTFDPRTDRAQHMNLTLGIYLACRGAHQASLARPDGSYTWTGKKFTRPPPRPRMNMGRPRTRRERHRNRGPRTHPQRLGARRLVVSSWFRRRGATIALVPTTQSADLRAYYWQTHQE